MGFTNFAIAAILLATACLIDRSDADDYSCANPPPCRKFSEIYANGKELCENMWDDAFTYEEEEDKGFVMWFYGDNPNAATADQLEALAHISGSDRDTCHLDYFHHDGAAQTGNDFAECAPWNDKACCANTTVRSATSLKESYGEHYQWDRCGKLSAACERFFVEEACFYECEPAAGHYRKHPNNLATAAQDGHRNEEFRGECDPYSDEYDATAECYHAGWQMYKMPIKASYCNAWHHACADDLFCSTDGGSFFSCAAQYGECDGQEADKAQQLKLQQAEDALQQAQAALQQATEEADNASGGGDTGPSNELVGGIVVGCAVVIGLGVLVAYRQGVRRGAALLPADNEAIGDDSATANPTFDGGFGLSD